MWHEKKHLINMKLLANLSFGAFPTIKNLTQRRFWLLLHMKKRQVSFNYTTQARTNCAPETHPIFRAGTFCLVKKKKQTNKFSVEYICKIMKMFFPSHYLKSVLQLPYSLPIRICLPILPYSMLIRIN